MLRRRNAQMILVFLAPTVLLYTLVFLYPVIRTTFMSLFKVEKVSQAVSTWTFYGFGNYADLFDSNLFKTSMVNILKLWFVGGAIVLSLAMVFAAILTNVACFKKTFRSIIYLPNVISAVAMGTMWLNYVYNVDYGLFNNIVTAFGLPGVMWTGPGLLFWSMLIAYGFGMVGYHMLIFISGIERISQDFYEAASIEGANIGHKFFYITLPLLKGVLRSNIVIWTVAISGFFVWGQLFSPVNLSSDTVTPVNYMYELVFGSSNSQTVRNAGGGAAIGVMLALLVVIVSSLTSLMVRKDDAEL